MNRLKYIFLSVLLVSVYSYAGGRDVTDYVNAFVGTSNFGTTNPGALCPNGMMSVTPFNVMAFHAGNPQGNQREDE